VLININFLTQVEVHVGEMYNQAAERWKYVPFGVSQDIATIDSVVLMSVFVVTTILTSLIRLI